MGLRMKSKHKVVPADILNRSGIVLSEAIEDYVVEENFVVKGLLFGN